MDTRFGFTLIAFSTAALVSPGSQCLQSYCIRNHGLPKRTVPDESRRRGADRAGDSFSVCGGLITPVCSLGRNQEGGIR